jgi:hypothetical protein
MNQASKREDKKAKDPANYQNYRNNIQKVLIS